MSARATAQTAKVGSSLPLTRCRHWAQRGREQRLGPNCPKLAQGGARWKAGAPQSARLATAQRPDAFTSGSLSARFCLPFALCAACPCGRFRVVCVGCARPRLAPPSLLASFGLSVGGPMVGPGLASLHPTLSRRPAGVPDMRSCSPGARSATMRHAEHPRGSSPRSEVGGKDAELCERPCGDPAARIEPARASYAVLLLRAQDHSTRAEPGGEGGRREELSRRQRSRQQPRVQTKPLGQQHSCRPAAS